MLTFVSLMLCCVVAGVVSAITLKGDLAQNQAAIDKASREWAMPMFCGSLLVAVAVSAWGVLPGTHRRPAVTTRPGVPADCDFRPDCDFPAAQPIIAVPIGS